MACNVNTVDNFALTLIDMILADVLLPKLKSAVAAVSEAAKQHPIDEITQNPAPTLEPAAAVEAARRRD